MYALLLDSSDKNLTVGLSQDGKAIDSIEYEAWQKQSEFMIQEVKNLLARHGLSRGDIGAVVCGKGPGSYTGVRIAMTIAKTIVFALGIPLYLASSLEILSDPIKPSICLMNARGKRSYMGVYERGRVLLKDCIKDNAEVLAYIEEHPDYAVCGDTGYLGIDSAPSDAVAALARCLDDAHKEAEPLGAKPIYLKDDYAEGRFKTVVRKMFPSDMEGVLAVERECFGAEAYSEQQIAYDLNENPVSAIYCAVVDHEVVGFIDFMITFDSASITQIAVKEKFRRKGVGNLLLGQLLKDCESKEDRVEFLTLEVRKSNEAALSFYKKHKFQNVTLKKGYYSDGEDAIYLVRSL